MGYYFDTEVAMTVGVNGAIILQNIAFWVKKNEANEAHYYDGSYWTYNSRKAFQKLFPFWTESVIKHALKKLHDEGYILVRQFGKDKMNHTNWYTLTAKAWAIFPHKQPTEPARKKHPIDEINLSNRLDKNHFPTIYTDNKHTDDKHQGGGVEPSPPTESSGFMKWYADNINPAFGPRMAEMVADLAKHYGNDACIKAGDIALKNNKRSLSYIEGILKRWETEGYSEHAPQPEPRRTGQKSVQEMYDEGMEILRKGGLV